MVKSQKNKGALVSLIVLVLLAIMSLVGPYMNDHGYDEQNLKHNNLPPRIPGLENVSWLPFDGDMQRKNGDVYNAYEQKNVDEYYWLGTDGLGRDIFTRVWKGTQVSLYIALLAAIIDMVIGVLYGAISGFIGGKTDNIMQRITEILVGIPNLVVVILMIIVLEPRYFIYYDCSNDYRLGWYGSGCKCSSIKTKGPRICSCCKNIRVI